MAKRASEDGPNPPRLTWEKFQAICATLEQVGLKNRACDIHNFQYDNVALTIQKQSLAGDNEWKELWDLSEERYRESLVSEAHRRAVDGVEEPVFHKGHLVGTVTRYSDRLLELMLKSKVPDFRTSITHQHTGAAIPALELINELTLPAQKAIRDIIVADLTAQAERMAATAALDDGTLLIEGDAREVGSSHEGDPSL